jgi:hypothetical protein
MYRAAALTSLEPVIVVVRGLHVRGANRQSLPDDVNDCLFTLRSNEA